MKIGYRKILEQAARQMILIHDPDVLIRLIIKTIIEAIGLEHAGFLLYDEEKGYYTLTVSGGKSGSKLPEGFARITKENALVKYFSYDYRIWKDDFLIYSRITKALKSDKILKDPLRKDLLSDLKYQMELHKAAVCIPCFFRKKLVGIVLLGEKTKRKAFVLSELGYLSILASDVAMAIENAKLFKGVRVQLDKNKKLFLRMIEVLSGAIEAKDKYTSGHTSRVTEISLKIFEELSRQGIVKEKKYQDRLRIKEMLHISALLHDIGKIGIPEYIINKPGPLSDEERKIIEQHPLIGVNILYPLRKEFKEAILGIKYHHERYDGGGYPEGLKGRRVSLIPAIIALADAYDAMTSDRPYRKALSKEKAIEEIIKNKGKQFRPDVVEAFLSVLMKEQI